MRGSLCPNERSRRSGGCPYCVCGEHYGDGTAGGISRNEARASPQLGAVIGETYGHHDRRGAASSHYERGDII